MIFNVIEQKCSGKILFAGNEEANMHYKPALGETVFRSPKRCLDSILIILLEECV